MSLVFVSPCLCDGIYGGVQQSGRIARERLAQHQRDQFHSLCYRGASRGAHRNGCAATKIEAARRAIGLRADCDTALVWHVGMLKLLPLLQRRGTKVYLFLHGVECWRKFDALTERLLGSVDTFLTNSAYTWLRFTEIHPRWRNARHRVVELGLGTGGAAAAPPATIPAALMAGRLSRGERYKGHAELIHAWRQVRAQLADAELWIAGGGDLEPDLKRIAAEEGVESQVRFFGTVSEEEKERLIRESRCLALPSRGEGFGLVYLEAMRFGRPCLVGDGDAAREVVNPPEAGLSVDPRNANALAEALVRLLTPGPEWDRWSASARARYESRFTAAHFEDRILLALGLAGKEVLYV